MIGTTIKDFKLVERLGRGGWGEVWAAEQTIVKTRVAIKLLRSEVSGDQAHVTRFFNEAIAVGSIPHAGIVKIFDVGFVNDQAFLIMELLAGESLSARIRRETRLPLDEVIDIGRQIASVLAATHAAGIVHRDLKPDNVHVVPDAELGERVKILDFGIAKLSTASVTGTGAIGTPAYMAPEQWNNAATADHRADLYSLGCVLFEMCCGRPPFTATSPGEACTKHLTEQPPRAQSFAPALPAEIDALIAGLLAKAADDRPTLAMVDQVLTTAAADAPRVIRPLPRGTGPIIRASTTGNRGSARDHAAGMAETATSTLDAGQAATVTSLAGAVMARTLPPPAPRRRGLAIAVGVLAGGAIAATITFAVTRSSPDEPIAERGSAPPVVEPPAYGINMIAEYRDPRPATAGNQRSEQVWAGAGDSYRKACTATSDKRWCAGERFATGELALIRDQVPAAVEAFEAAVKLDPSWATGYLGLATALSYARRLEPALAAARHAQELEPTAWQPAAVSARAYIAVGNVDDALIEYRRALDASPKRNVLLIAEVALAYHYAHKDEEAQRFAAEATAIEPTLVSIELMRSELALEAGQGKPALDAAERALALSPKNGAALLARGDAFAILGNKEQALASYRHAAKLRGGKNILAISEPRLALVDEALTRDALPVARTTTRSPATNTPPTDAPAGQRKPPTDATGGRSLPTGNPGARAARAATMGVMEDRTPPANSNTEPTEPPAVERTPPAPPDQLPRSPSTQDSRPPPPRSPPPTTEPPARSPPARSTQPQPRPPPPRPKPSPRSPPARPDLNL